MSVESVRAASRWTTRIIPLVLAASVGYSAYVIVARVCADYLIHARGEVGSAIAILVLYFLMLLLMLASYLRTIVIINTDSPVVPLGPLAIGRRESQKSQQPPRTRRRARDVESQPYCATPDPNPDSPGLELFYTKNVFVCENDGRPKWCSECCNWKPDRAHHSSEIGRCVIRMDHYCPWVGGMVAENSFKFFSQFVMYTWFFCAVVLGAAGSTLRKQMDAGYTLDGYLVAVLVLSGFYGLFTFLMTLTSWRYIFTNLTNVDMIGARRKVYQLAVRIPRGSAATDKYHTVTYPLPRPANQAIGQTDGPAQLDGGRDGIAARTFAIVKTEPGENPWNLGLWENWKEVMGTNPLDWFLPITRSPCVNHDSQESYYRMGPVVEKIRAEYGIGGLSADEADMLELRNLGRNTT